MREERRVEIKNFTDLMAWKLAHELRKEIYKMASTFPSSEKYNLIPQMRRAVFSVGANIAEGFGRFHYQENIQFCRQARGSLAEVHDGVIFARDIGYLTDVIFKDIEKRVDNCRQVLNGYIRSLLKSKSHNS